MTSHESALLFSYGITNAGKTHSVLGDINSSNQSNWGIIPRAISEVYSRIAFQSNNNNNNNNNSRNGQVSSSLPTFQLYVSFFEIYNEQVYDLIPSKSSLSKHLFGVQPSLKVRECRGQTLVRGLAKHKVTSIEQGIELIKQAHNKRHTSSNNLNSDSSRSHFVCQMEIASSNTGVAGAKIIPAKRFASTMDDDASSVASMSGYSTDEEVSRRTNQIIGNLWIVDLAGSERSKRTKVTTSMRQKESTQINKSLMTLMRCLNAIKDNGKNGSSSSNNNVVPFRESKLTHIFMSHLTSRSASRTGILVNVNPAIDDFDETQHVLAYARKAKLIEMDPDEYCRKRKQYFGEEYDLNGRKKVKPINKNQSPEEKAAKKPDNISFTNG